MSTALEDDLCDILRKAQRGTGTSAETIAERTGIALERITSWIQGTSIPNGDEARAIAVVLRLDPGKLADRAAGRRAHPHIPLPSDVRHHPQDPHPSNGYIFFLQDGLTAAIIDPAGYPEQLLRAVREGAYALRYILITHKHADHCDATADIAQAFPQAQIVMHQKDMHAIGPLAHRAIPVTDTTVLPFGPNAEIRMLHTPGHTDGSACFLFAESIFTGDTLFAGSVGGAYGEISTYDDILNSVRCKIFSLADDIVVMPGHGPPTTIAEEKQHNPFF